MKSPRVKSCVYGHRWFIYLEWGPREDELRISCLTRCSGFNLLPKCFMSILEAILFFWEFVFPDCKNMDGLLLNTVVISGARFYVSTVYFPIFYNYLLICHFCHFMDIVETRVRVGPFYVSQLHPVKSINTPTVPHWAPPLRAPRRVRHPAACPPYLEYFAPIADLLPLIVLSVYREPRFLPLFAAPCHPFLQHAAWWVQIASLFLKSAGCFRWRPCVWWMNSRSSTGQSRRVQSVRAGAVRKLEHRNKKKERNEFTTSGSMKRVFLRIRQRSSFHLWVLISHHRTLLNGTKLFYHSWLLSIQKICNESHHEYKRIY